MASNVLEWIARVQTREGQVALGGLASSADTASTSLDRADQRSQRLGRTANQLAGALSLVHPQAGEAARTVGDLTTAMEAAAGGGRLLGVGLGPVAGIIAAISGAVVIGVGLWKSYSEEAEIAARAAALNADAHKALKPLLDDAARSTVALAVATGELSAAEGEARLKSMASLSAWSSATQAQRSRINELQREQSSVKTQIVDALSSVTFGPTAIVLDGLTDSTADLRQEMHALQGDVAASTEILASTVAVGQEVIKVEAAQTRARRANAAALKEQNAAAAEAAKLDAAYMRWTSQIANANDQLDALSPGLDQAAQALDEVADSMTRAAEIGLAWEATLLRIADAQTAAATRAAYAAQIQGGRSMAGAGLLSLATGDGSGLAGALSGAGQALGYRGLQLGMESGGAAGRGSALLGAGLGGLGSLAGALGPLAQIGGAADPAKAARQQANAFKDAVIGGIEALPEILVEIIPELVGALVRELPRAIAESLGELLNRLLAKIFPNLFGKGTLSTEETLAVASTVTTAATSTTTAAVRAAQSSASSSRMLAGRPSFLDLGGPGSVRGMRGARGGATVINQINTVTLDGLSGFNRENERMYGAGGLRESV